MTRPRRPAGDLIEAILENMRANLEELRYTTVAPSRYTVYLSPAEHARLEGILPRLQAETMRALDEELRRLNRRGRVRRLFGRWMAPAAPLENADRHWHVAFLPDFDGELQHEQDILVQSELLLPAPPELGSGERTRRVTTTHTGGRLARETTDRPAPATAALRPSHTPALARLTYEDRRGSHTFEIVRESTTIGRGGTMFPVDVRVAASEDVSREHARIRHDAATGDWFLIDLSTHGTSVDGRPIPRGFDDADGGKRENGVESALPPRARIGLAGLVFLDFERLR